MRFLFNVQGAPFCVKLDYAIAAGITHAIGKHGRATLAQIGAPYLVKDQEGRTKCVSCQLCEFVCPPKAIRIVPPGPSGAPEAGNVEKAPKEFEINMLRCIFCGFCQEVCPEEAIFLLKDYSLTGTSREELIYNKEKLLALGGVHQDQIRKWKKKADQALAQGVAP